MTSGLSEADVIGGPRLRGPDGRCALIIGSMALLTWLAGCGALGGGSGAADDAAQQKGVTPEGKVGTASAEPEVLAFTIDVRAPDTIRELLETHLELKRYRALTDLTEAEMAGLLEAASRNVRELVATQGYFSPEVRISRHGRLGQQPTIVIEVDPGAITEVVAVDIEFQGDIQGALDAEGIEQREEIRKQWRLPAGTPFTQAAWAGAKQEALRELVAKRYPAGKIADSQAVIDVPGKTATLHVQIDSGPEYRYGPMNVTGIERYDPVIVPRVARLKPGEVYDQKKINDAQQRLTGTGYFDSAFIFVDPDTPDPDAVPVQVTLREAPRKKVVFGAGLTTDGGPHLSAEYTDLRVPGIGWRAATKLQLETKNPFAQTDWLSTPDERGWRWGVFGRFERLDDDELITTAQNLRIGRSKTGEKYDRNVYVQYDRASVHGSGADDASNAAIGDGSALSVNTIWTGRYFDSLPYPTSGHGVSAELGGGYTLSAPRKPFVRTVLRWLGIVPLPANQGRIALRAEGGAIQASSDARIPGTQMFRIGGDTTVRGYAYRGIGIERADGAIRPGRYMAAGSIEWQRPFIKDGVPTAFENTLFVDLGDVANEPGDLRPVYGVGTGVRVRTPIGPLAAAIAYGLDRHELRLHLTIGFTF